MTGSIGIIDRATPSNNNECHNSNDDMYSSSQNSTSTAVINRLLPYLKRDEPLLPTNLQRARESLLHDGYCVLPSVLNEQECDDALDSIWDFIEDISGGMVHKDDPMSWYPQQKKTQTRTQNAGPGEVLQGDGGGNEEEEEEDGEDPWPYTTENSNLPDMFQSYGAGFVLGRMRERLAEKVFEPLLGTKELHCSKEGFAFQRPSRIPSAQNGTNHVWNRKTWVGGEDTPKKDCDPSQSDMGLHSIQSLVALVDQKEPNGGHFLCYPRSQDEVVTQTQRKKGGTCDELTDAEIEELCAEHNIEPKRIWLKAGDIILWRSDLVYTHVPPTDNTTDFHAVGYVSMTPAEFTPSYPGIWKKKLDAYKMARTGDSRPFVESWYEHCRTTAEGKDDGILQQRQRPYHRFCPPMISMRLAELYGLIPYNLTSETRQKEVDRAIIRGVRFLSSVVDQTHSSRDIIPICNARTETIFLPGNNKSLPGQDKYLGGMTSPCGRYIYGVPGHAQRVLYVDTETGEMNFMGPQYPGKFKWLRGVEIPPDIMQSPEEYPRGCCIALPSNAPSILKINPETNDVYTFGGPMPGKGWMYHGGNLASDGLVYAIPANATRVLVIDPRKDETYCVGPEYPGIQKWYGGIVGCDGCIYGIPHNSSGVLRIDPSSQTCEVLGEGTLPEGQWKWHGGLASTDGRKIIGFPNNADSVLVIDVMESRVYTIGDDKVLKSGRHRIPQDGRYKYLGGALTQDGRYAYLFPCDAERVLRIDMERDELSLVGPEFLEGENKYQNGFVARDGCLYGIPQRAAGVLRVVPPGVQRFDSNGNSVDDTEEHVDVLYCGEDMVSIKDKFEGGVLGLDGCIYCIPLRAKALFKVIPGPSI